MALNKLLFCEPPQHFWTATSQNDFFFENFILGRWTMEKIR